MQWFRSPPESVAVEESRYRDTNTLISPERTHIDSVGWRMSFQMVLVFISHNCWIIKDVMLLMYLSPSFTLENVELPLQGLLLCWSSYRTGTREK